MKSDFITGAMWRINGGKMRKWGPDASESGVDEISEKICRGLGGRENISDVDCCATRLRCTVHHAGKVDKQILQSTGASGVIQKGEGVQIIYGPRVTVIKSNLEDYLDKDVEPPAPERVYKIYSPFSAAPQISRRRRMRAFPAE